MPWPIPEPLAAWHGAIDLLVRHTATCKRCGQVEAYGRHPFNRCETGRDLYQAEQAAYQAWVSDKYAGRAVA